MTEEVKANAAVEGSDAKNDSAMDTTAESTEKKEGDETEPPAGEGDEQKEEDKAAKKGFRYRDGANATADEHSNSPYLRVKNRNLIAALSENLEKSQASLKEIFTDTLGVAIPKVKLPMVTHLYVEMASLEDKFKVLSNTPRPERWNSNKKLSPTAVITQSVVVRDETLPPAEKGTLEEALEELLPLRKMLYKDQLDLKFKELDANVDSAVEVTNIVLAKGKRKKIESVSKLTKPPVDSIVPMIPNVGYDRNVILNLEKDATGKLIPGIRVTYEKDEVKKRFLLPVSECTHIAPQIVKAAQELCAHLSTGNVKVFDGVEENADIYSLKFTMNDIGEIIISVVLVLKDYFDEFFDLMEKDALSQQVADYFEVIKTKGKQQIIKEANENGGDVAELNGDEDAANEEEEEEEKAEENAKTSEEKDESADKPAEEEKKDEEKKDEEVKAADDDDISILREGARRSIPLKKCPNLTRMEPVMREQLNRFSPELKKFFEEKGTTLGVTGVFITWYIVNKLPTDFSRNLKYWYHVCGNESVTETVNNVKLELIPHLEFLHPSRPQVVPMIMNVLTDALGIDSNSRAVVASDYHMVQSFFAQKCNKTMFLTYQNEAMKNDVKRKHRDRVTCVSGKTKHTNIIEKCKQFFSDLPNIVVHWGAYRENAIKALFLHRVAKVAIIFDPQENITFRNHGSSAEIIKKLNCSLHPQYTLKKIIGIDVGPLKKGPVTVIAIYETVPGFFNMNRGIKRKGPMYGGPNSNKRPMQGNRQMNDRFGDRRRGGMGGGGYGNKRQRMDDNNRRPPQPLLAARGGGPNRSRFNQRPPHPWNDNRRFEPYNGRGGGGGGFNNQGGPQEPTVQAAKAVLSQLNSIIENQLMLAQIKSGPDPNQNRGRPNDGGWVSGNRRDDFGGNRDGPSSFANDQDYFSRDRSPPTYGGGGNRGFNDNRGGGGGFNDNAGRNYGGGGNMNRNFGGGDSNRGFGGGDMNRRVGGGGMGGGGGGGGMNRRNMGGGGGGGGGGAGKPFRFNNRRN